MKPYTKGLLVGLLLAFSCVGFMASKSNPVGTYVKWGDNSIYNTRTAQVYVSRTISVIGERRFIPWQHIASDEEIEYYKEEYK